MLKAVSKDVLQPFAGELRTVFSTVKGLRNPLYIYFCTGFVSHVRYSVSDDVLLLYQLVNKRSGDF